MPGTFARWTKEGQLATLVMGVVFITWLGFQIFVAPLERPTILNEVLLAVLGAWVTNLGYGVKKSNDRSAQEDRDAEEAAFEKRVDAAMKKRQEAGNAS